MFSGACRASSILYWACSSSLPIEAVGFGVLAGTGSLGPATVFFLMTGACMYKSLSMTSSDMCAGGGHIFFFLGNEQLISFLVALSSHKFS